jgi:hypothetical protein
MQRRADRFHHAGQVSIDALFRGSQHVKTHRGLRTISLTHPAGLRPATLPEDGEGWTEPVERDKRSRAEKDARSGESHARAKGCATGCGAAHWLPAPRRKNLAVTRG